MMTDTHKHTHTATQPQCQQPEKFGSDDQCLTFAPVRIMYELQ